MVIKMIVDGKEILGGVINTNNVMWLWDEVFNNGINISFENYMSECPDDKDKEEWADNYYPDEETYYIGMIKIMDGHEDNIIYEINKDVEYSAIVSSMYTQVIRSKYFSYAYHCSPCFPGQNDLGTSGDNPTYALPAELYDDSNKHLKIFKIGA